MARWFRFYTETLEHPKAQRLPGDVFKGWVNLLCLAARNDGKLPPHADIAFALRMTGTKVTALLDALVEATLLDHDDNGLRPHNWNTRQYKSDVSNERVKRHREQVGAVTCNVTIPVTETPPEAETESEQIKPTPNGVAKKPKRKTAIAPDWKPDERDCFYAASKGWPDARIDAEAEKFRNSNAANDRRYADWNAAWRTWVGNADRFAAKPAGGRGRATEGERRSAIYASVAGELGDRGDASGEHGRPGNGIGGDRCDVGPGGPESLRSLAGPALCEPPYATEGIADDVAGIAGPVSAGRTQAGNGSRFADAQMGNPAQDCPGDRGGGIGPTLSAAAVREVNFAEGDHASGMGRTGPEEDYFDLPSFLRRQA